MPEFPTNQFEFILKALKIPHTPYYAAKTYVSHPYYDSFWGITRMCEHYGISYRAFRMKDKSLIHDLPQPFLAQTAHSFVLVTKADEQNVLYEEGGSYHTLPISRFLQLWTGVCLTFDTTCETREPNYKSHRRTNLLQMVSQRAFACCILILGGLLCAYGFPMTSTHSFLWGTQITGIFLCLALIKETLIEASKSRHSLCSLIDENGCQSVLHSPHARLVGLFDWSAIGLSYFIANTILMLVAPHESEPIQYVTSIAALIVPVGSIAYQWKRRQWCMLCLGVQLTLIVQAAICLFSETLPHAPLHIPYIVAYAASAYVILFVIQHGIEGCKQKRTLFHTRCELSRFKHHPTIFKELLSLQPTVTCNSATSSLIFGKNRKDKPVITVLSNLYCQPCAQAQQQLNKLEEDGLCIQYVLTAFNESLAVVNRYVVALYLKTGTKYTWQKLNEWHTLEERQRTRSFFHEVSDEEARSPEVEAEIRREAVWCADNHFAATPIILVDGHTLPTQYAVEDLAKIFRE